MTTTDSKDWIKARISALRKQANLNFNQDLFISILLCLVSGEGKHLVLIADPAQVHEVSKMAEQICYSIFGLTCAFVACDFNQTPADFVASLFTRTRDEVTHHTFAITSDNANDQSTSRSTFLRAQKSTRSIKTIGSAHSATNNEAGPSSSSRQHFRKESNQSAKNSTRKRSSSAATSRKSQERIDSPLTASSFRHDTPTRGSSQPVLLSPSTAYGISTTFGSSAIDEPNQFVDSEIKDRTLPSSLRTSFSVSNSDPNPPNNYLGARRVRHPDESHNAHIPRLSSSSVISTNSPATHDTGGSSAIPSSSGTGSRRSTVSTTAATTGASTGHNHIHHIPAHSSASPPSVAASTSPISPVDFTFTQRRRESSANGTSGVGNRSSRGPSLSLSTAGDFAGGDHRSEGRSGGGEWGNDRGGLSSGVGISGGNATTGNGVYYPSSSKRLAQAVVLEGLNAASELVQASLLEMMIRKHVTDRVAVYNIPRPFIVIAVLPKSKAGVRATMLSQLIDHFYISYAFDGPLSQPSVVNTISPTNENINQPSGRSSSVYSSSSMVLSQAQVTPQQVGGIMGRRTPWLKNTEIEELARQKSLVAVTNDITCYIRDIVVGIRTHRKVRGGLTTRTSTDLVEVVRALAAIFHLEFVTPELVLIASEKVLAHRLVLVDQSASVADEGLGDDENNEESGNFSTNEDDQVASEDGSVVIQQKALRPLGMRNRRTLSNSLSWTGNERDVETRGIREKVAWVTPAEVVADVLQVVWPPV